MFEEISAKDAFKLIKENHKRYLDGNMVTHLEAIDGSRNKEALIEEFLLKLESYHGQKEDYLNEVIQPESRSSQLGRGALSALVGAGVAGLVFFLGKKSTDVADAFNPLGGAKEAVEGVFAGAIGASFSVAMYKVWGSIAEKDVQADDKQVRADIKKAGFQDRRYQALPSNLVKLFHFRECLLTNIEDMRIAFIQRNMHMFQNTKLVDIQKVFDIAIEVYFLRSLNDLFHDAFEKIYEIHDDEIQSEKKSPVIGWFKKHFESAENRTQFTQQMQVEFMDICINFLQHEMNEHSALDKHVYLMDTFVGLVAGSIALGVAAAVFPISLLGLVGIAVVVAAIAAVSTHMAITHVDSIKFKRSQANRDGIESAVKDIQQERTRLSILIKQVVLTSNDELDELKAFENKGKPGFWSFLPLFSSKAMWLGGVRSWIREYARRYNHSKIVEIDLSEQELSIIDLAQRQTQELQDELVKFMSTDDKKSTTPSLLRTYLENTQNYLKPPSPDTKKEDSHAEFIRIFQIKQKIREQLIEIVAALPVKTVRKDLPDLLVKFYTNPIDKGGLGGLRSDLERVRSIAPIVDDKIPVDAKHPYRRLADVAQRINDQLNDETTPQFQTIFPGENRYRRLLGMPEKRFFHVADHLKSDDIQVWLQASFDFLCSLNCYDKDPDAPWEKPFQNTDEFNVYRMLLVKQLATLWDPLNQHVDPDIKNDIARFARDKLKTEPTIAFVDILNQSLLISEPDTTAPKIPGKIHAISLPGLIDAAAAIRIDMAYDVSVPPSAKMLIDIAAKSFLRTDNSQIILSYDNALFKLVPEASDDFYQSLDGALNSTNAFIASIHQNDLLMKTGTVRRYLKEVLKELDTLKSEINSLVEELTSSQHAGQDNPTPKNPQLVLLSKIEQIIEFSKQINGVIANLPVLTIPSEPNTDQPAEESHHGLHEASSGLMLNLHVNTPATVDSSPSLGEKMKRAVSQVFDNIIPRPKTPTPRGSIDSIHAAVHSGEKGGSSHVIAEIKKSTHSRPASPVTVLITSPGGVTHEKTSTPSNSPPESVVGGEHGSVDSNGLSKQVSSELHASTAVKKTTSTAALSPSKNSLSKQSGITISHHHSVGSLFGFHPPPPEPTPLSTTVRSKSAIKLNLPPSPLGKRKDAPKESDAVISPTSSLGEKAASSSRLNTAEPVSAPSRSPSPKAPSPRASSPRAPSPRAASPKAPSPKVPSRASSPVTEHPIPHPIIDSTMMPDVSSANEATAVEPSQFGPDFSKFILSIEAYKSYEEQQIKKTHFFSRATPQQKIVAASHLLKALGDLQTGALGSIPDWVDDPIFVRSDRLRAAVNEGILSMGNGGVRDEGLRVFFQRHLQQVAPTFNAAFK